MAFRYLATLSFLAAMALAGCGQEPWPEVNSENCQTKEIMQMKGKERREEFGSFCAVIPSSVWPMDPEKWYLMSAEEQHKHLMEGLRRGRTPNAESWLFKQP